MTAPFRQVMILIYDPSTKDYIFDRDAQSTKIISFNYNPSFDPWDNMAVGRFLYQKQKEKDVNTDMKFVAMLEDGDFTELLNLINDQQVVLTINDMKCFLFQTDKLKGLDDLVKIKDQDLADNLNLFSEQERMIIQKYLMDKIQDSITKKTFCILDAETHSETFERYTLRALFQGLYQEQNEIWMYKKVYNGEFPSDQEFDSIDGFTITGSSSTAYIQEPWYDKFQEFLKKIVESNKNTLGICFGHQIIAQFFGGATAQLEVLPKEHFNYYGVKNINIVGDNNSFQVLVLHGDNVTVLPTGSTLLMTSDYCPIQAYIKKNILSLQFHPEFSIPMIKFLMKQCADTINIEELFGRFDSSQNTYNSTSLMIRQALITFLKQGELQFKVQNMTQELQQQ